MCMIAFQPKGLPPLSREVFDNAWSHNDDGAGIAYIAKGKMVIEKPFFKLKTLWKAYKAAHAKYGQKSPILVHFRWSTHGSNNEVNTHPHMLCGGHIALAHNGILPFEPPKSEGDISDTVWFCRTVLNYRTYEHLLDENFRGILEDMVGANKLVLMGDEGDVSIINENLGTWDDGVWYSNTDFKTKHIRKVYSGRYCGSSCNSTTPLFNAAQSALPRHYATSGSNRPDEWEGRLFPDGDGDTPANEYNLDDAQIAEIRTEYAALELKAANGGLGLEEWERYELCCDILDEVSGGESEDDRERREWAELKQAESEGKDSAYWTNKAIDSQFDAAINKGA